MDENQSINEQQRQMEEVARELQELAKRSSFGLAKAMSREREKRYSFGGKGFEYERKSKNKIQEYTSLSSQFGAINNIFQIVILVAHIPQFQPEGI